MAAGYDRISKYFLKWEPSPQFRKIMDSVLIRFIDNELSRANGKEKVRILDMGCGHGTWIEYILSKIKNPENLWITGIDLSKERILIAKSILADKPNIVLQTADFMGYNPIETFNVILIADVLELIEEKYYEQILRRCYGLLRDCGYTIIVDKDRNSFFYLKFLARRMMKMFPRDYLEGGTYKFIHFPSFKYLCKIAQHNDFHVLHQSRIEEFHALVLLKNSSSQIGGTQQ